MSERKIRKLFREGDPVILESREGVLRSLLSAQYFVEWVDDPGNGEFHFYNEGMIITLDESRPRPRVKRARKQKVT